MQQTSLPEAKKDDTGKVRYSLIPSGPLRELAKVYSSGADHYGDHNWTKGLSYSRLLDAAFRHIEAYRSGQISSEHLFNGEPLHHLAHAAFSLFAIISQDQRGLTALNDLHQEAPQLEEVKPTLPPEAAEALAFIQENPDWQSSLELESDSEADLSPEDQQDRDDLSYDVKRWHERYKKDLEAEAAGLPPYCPEEGFSDNR